MDNEITLSDLKLVVEKFLEERNWKKFHSPKNLSMSIAIEAAELMENFQWLSIEESKDLLKDPIRLNDVSSELADVIIYCLSFSSSTGIDISDIVNRKVKLNSDRFPANIEFDPFKGK